MINLHSFYLNQYGLNILAQLILVSAVLFYLFRIPDSTRVAWYTRLFFLALAGNILFNLIESTAVWSLQYHIENFRFIFLFLALFAALQTVYRFPLVENEPFEKQRKRERPIVTVVSLLALFLAIFWAVFQFQQLRSGGMPRPQPQIVGIGVGLFVLWVLLTNIRHLVALANKHSPRRWGWHHFPADQQRQVKAAYGLLSLAPYVLFLTICMTLSLAGFLPVWIQEIVPTIGFTILVFLLSIALLAESLVNTTLMVRLIWPVLLVILLGLGLAGIIIANVYANTIEVRPAFIEPQTVLFEPVSADSYQVTTNPVALDTEWGGELTTADSVLLPFDFPFFDQQWSALNLEEAGVVAFGSWNQILFSYNYLPALVVFHPADIQPWRTFVKVGEAQATVTWQPVSAESGIVQAVLYADGRFDFTYSRLDGTALQRIGFQSGDGGTSFTAYEPNSIAPELIVTGDGPLNDYDVLYQAALHPLIVPLAYLIVVASLLSVWGFPLLLQANLIKPLNALVSGVKSVDSGNLEVQIPVQSDDELGLVTKAFNQMVRTVQQSEKSLEARVEERTKALADTERKLGALEERERIGRELHDDLGQVMGYVHLQVDTALTRLRRNEQLQAEQILADVGRVAQEAHNDVRQFILGVRSGKESRRDITFWQALDEYLASISNRYDFEIELTGMAELKTDLMLDPLVETQLLRIIQEGLTNVHKHAGATQATLHLTRQGEWLQLMLKDNGRGFELTTGKAAEAGHFGLEIMRERAESVNGRLEIISAADKGTQLQVEVPSLVKTTLLAEAQQIPWRVLLVDDHALFREGLANMLRPHGIQIVGTAENGRDGEKLAAELQPDLILMDIHMPEQDGLATTQRIKEQFPDIKVVMLTMGVEDQLLLTALSNGASGYLLKSLPASQFLTLLSEVMAGKTIISPDLASQVLSTLAQNTAFPAADQVEASIQALLTDRQQDVLKLIGQGMNNRQIAAALFISESTVKYHIRQIMERLGLETRHELIVYELDNQG